VGKKNIDLMRKVKVDFVEGAMKTSGAKKETAELFWDQLEEFANYCFNKSHAACYGLIAYWTAYLKAHFPEAFMAALMTSDADDTERLAIEITECKYMGIKVLSPDVNESFVEFAVVPDKKEIRFGMSAVKGVGVGVVEEILRAREHGKFASVEDFAKRVSTQKVNKKAWDSLIKTGAFDAMADRSDLLFNLETIQAFASKLQKEALSGQTDLFGGMSDVANIQPTVSLAPAPVKHTEKERLTWERELLGLYISAHPLDNYDAYFSEQTVPVAEMTQDIDGKALTIGGLVSSVRTIVTKSGTKMAFVKLEDKTGETEIIVFPNLFELVGAKLVQDAVVRVSGKVSARDREGVLTTDVKMIADDIQEVDEEELRTYESTGRIMTKPKAGKLVTVKKKADRSKWSGGNGGGGFNKPVAAGPGVSAPRESSGPPPTAEVLKTVYVHVKNPDDQTVLMQIRSECSKSPGLSDIILVLGPEKQSAIKMPFRVDGGDELVGRLVKLLGEDAVALK
jgi:DNA polymerase-3 subunit alpha